MGDTMINYPGRTPRVMTTADDMFNPIDDVWRFCQWCREYCKAANPANHVQRVACGIYQYIQAMQYPIGQSERDAGFAACVIHTVGAAELLSVDMAAYMPPSMSGDHILEEPVIVLSVVGRLLQLHFYRSACKPHEVRYIRASAEVIGQTTARLARMALAHIRPQDRLEAILASVAQLMKFEFRK